MRWGEVVCKGDGLLRQFLARKLHGTEICRFVTMIYNHYNSGHHLSCCVLFKTRHFGYWILSLSPETKTSSIYRTQMSRFHLETETYAEVTIITVRYGYA
jgi:hypothetical protein